MDQQTNNNYGVKVEMFIKEPKYMGAISEEEAVNRGATLYNFTYGDEILNYKLTLHWAVNTHEDSIVLARYSYEGIPSGIAVNHMLALLCTNKNMNEIETINYQGLERFLRDNPNIEALPSSESYAITFALDAVKLAVKQYINKPLQHDESTIPCKDSPMSISSLKESIALHKIETLEALSEHTKAGSSDLGCSDQLLTLIEEHKKELSEVKEAENALSDVPFKDLSPEHRIVAVDIAVDNTVRDFLVMDGGDIDIVSVKENGEMFEVYISYLGACSSCSSSGTGTLYGIQNALREKLDPNIVVIPI